MALILPLDIPLPASRSFKDDFDLQITHVWARKRQDSAIISLESIVQGALLLEDDSPGCEGDYIVMSVIDQDMW